MECRMSDGIEPAVRLRNTAIRNTQHAPRLRQTWQKTAGTTRRSSPHRPEVPGTAPPGPHRAPCRPAARPAGCTARRTVPIASWRCSPAPAQHRKAWPTRTRKAHHRGTKTQRYGDTETRERSLRVSRVSCCLLVSLSPCLLVSLFPCFPTLRNPNTAGTRQTRPIRKTKAAAGCTWESVRAPPEAGCRACR